MSSEKDAKTALLWLLRQSPAAVREHQPATPSEPAPPAAAHNYPPSSPPHLPPYPPFLSRHLQVTHMGNGASAAGATLPGPPPQQATGGSPRPAQVARLVVLQPGKAPHGLVLQDGDGTSSGPVIVALNEGGRGLASCSFVLGDRVTHINPRHLVGNARAARPSTADRLRDREEAKKLLDELRPGTDARVWVMRPRTTVARVRKPASGQFGIVFVTICGGCRRSNHNSVSLAAATNGPGPPGQSAMLRISCSSSLSWRAARRTGAAACPRARGSRRCAASPRPPPRPPRVCSEAWPRGRRPPCAALRSNFGPGGRVGAGPLSPRPLLPSRNSWTSTTRSGTTATSSRPSTSRSPAASQPRPPATEPRCAWCRCSRLASRSHATLRSCGSTTRVALASSARERERGRERECTGVHV